MNDLSFDQKVTQRAYSVLTVKAFDDDERVITGMATTPTPDRSGDVVEPLGVKYRNPLPLLHHHDPQAPVGTVRFSKPTKDGIEFTARLPKVDEPPSLKDRIDTAWGEIKLGLVRGVSIGFRALEYSFMDEGGIRFLESEVLELSLVSIPANSEATITTIKQIDGDERAALGQKVRRVSPPGVSVSPIVRLKDSKAMTKKTYTEQIAEFGSVRKVKADRMDAIMDAASEAGTTLDAEQKEEYDTLASEVKSLDEHLERLRAHEARNKAAAVVVAGDDPPAADRSRAGLQPYVTVVKAAPLPPGTAFTRFTMALMAGRGSLLQALEIAKGQARWKDTPEVELSLKAAVAAGTTTDPTWAAPLVFYNNMAGEFVDYLRPMTIIGRIQGFRRVPFKVKVPRQTAASSVNWVGEGKVKPVSKLAFDTITMEAYKIAGIVAMTEELVRFSDPSAETLVRDDLAKSIVEFMDREFIDPAKALAAGVSPASITWGVTPVPASGTTAAALRTDIAALMQKWLDAEMSPNTGVWIMPAGLAMKIGMIQNSLGQKEYPGLDVNGGTLAGLPVVASENMPYTGGSPAGGQMIVLAKAGEIMLADDGQATVDASREASLQMDTAPDSPATGATNLVSLWQHNMVGIKAERYINWQKRRAEAVQYISGAKYTG